MTKFDQALEAGLHDVAFDVPTQGYVARGLVRLLAAGDDQLNAAIKSTGANPVRLRSVLDRFSNAPDGETLYTIHAPDLAAIVRAAMAKLIEPAPSLKDVINIPEDVSEEERTKIIAQASTVVNLHAAFEANKFHSAECAAWIQASMGTLNNLRKAMLSKDHAQVALKSHGFRRLRRKIGRNERCPCGSARKYKVCCGLKALSDSDGPRVLLEKEDET